jgi:hypothetical protein
MEMNGELQAPTALPIRKEPLYLWRDGWAGLRANLDMAVK